MHTILCINYVTTNFRMLNSDRLGGMPPRTPLRHCSRCTEWPGNFCHVPLLPASFYNLLTVDGGWSEWEPVKPCNKPCGGGQKRQYRYCNNPWPANGGMECSGPNVNIVPCNTHSCPGIRNIEPIFYGVCCVCFVL